VSAATPDQFPQQFKSRNREEPSRYIHDILIFDYVVELFSSRHQLNYHYAINQQLIITDQRQEIVSFPFLDAGATSSTLGRTLYAPPWLLKLLHTPVYFSKHDFFTKLSYN
jgi:hypothetical protein